MHPVDLQMKARNKAAHAAVDWLFPAGTAIAAVEQACLQPSPELPWSAELQSQVSLHLTESSVVLLCISKMYVG